ncbi:MAG: hypothetical protein AMK75_06770, partial [Planctomycetes bacterium SM23_65]
MTRRGGPVNRWLVMMRALVMINVLLLAFSAGVWPQQATGEEEKGRADWTAAERALAEAIERDGGAASHGVTRSQKESLRLWEQFLQREDIADEHRIFAWWRIGALYAYNFDESQGEKADFPRAEAALTKALATVGELVSREKMLAACTLGQIPGTPREEAARLAKAYRWLTTRTDDMIREGAARTNNRYGYLIDRKLFPELMTSDVPSHRWMSGNMKSRLADSLSAVEECITDSIRSSRNAQATSKLLESIEAVAPPERMTAWRALAAAVEKNPLPQREAAPDGGPPKKWNKLPRIRHTTSVGLEPRPIPELEMFRECRDAVREFEKEHLHSSTAEKRKAAVPVLEKLDKLAREYPDVEPGVDALFMKMDLYMMCRENARAAEVAGEIALRYSEYPESVKARIHWAGQLMVMGNTWKAVRVLEVAERAGRERDAYRFGETRRSVLHRLAEAHERLGNRRQVKAVRAQIAEEAAAKKRRLAHLDRTKWTPAELALAETIEGPGGALPEGTTRSQLTSIAAWKRFLEREDITDEHRVFAYWRLGALYAYQFREERGERSYPSEAEEAFTRAIETVPDLVSWETIQASHFLTGMGGVPADRARRLAKAYRWFAGRTEAMIRKWAGRVNGYYYVIDRKLIPALAREDTLPYEVRLRELTRRYKDTRAKVEGRITHRLDASNDPVAARALLDGVRDVAPAELGLKWEQLARAVEERAGPLVVKPGWDKDLHVRRTIVSADGKKMLVYDGRRLVFFDGLGGDARPVAQAGCSKQKVIASKQGRYVVLYTQFIG